MGAVTSSMAAKFAFFPPDPPSYTVAEEAEGRARMAEVALRENVDVLKVFTKYILKGCFCYEQEAHDTVCTMDHSSPFKA